MSIFKLNGVINPVAKQAALRRAERQVQDAFKKAVRAYIDALLFDSPLTVQSGMSASTVIPLARSVQYFKAASRAVGSMFGSSKEGFAHTSQTRPYKSFMFPPNGVKSRAQGIKMGEDAFRLEMPTLQNGLKGLMEFKIVVLQWYLKENGMGMGQKDAPWKSMPVAEEAFRDTLKRDLAAIAAGGIYDGRI